MNPNDDTHKLIDMINRKDRRFRIAQTMFMITLLATLAGVLVAQVRTLQVIKTEVNSVNRHLDCIIVYFGQRNRTTLTIEDINKCTISNSEGVRQFFDDSGNNRNDPQTSTGRSTAAITPQVNSNTTPTRTQTETSAPPEPDTPIASAPTVGDIIDASLQSGLNLVDNVVKDTSGLTQGLLKR